MTRPLSVLLGCCLLVLPLVAEDGWTMNESGVVTYEGQWRLERTGRLLLEGSSVDRYRSEQLAPGHVGWTLERYALRAERRFLPDRDSDAVCLVDEVVNLRDEERVISVAYEFWLSESIASIRTEHAFFDLQQGGLSGPIGDAALQLRGRDGTGLTVLLAAPVEGIPSVRSELRRSNCIYSRFQIRIPAEGRIRMALILPEPREGFDHAEDLGLLFRRWYAGVIVDSVPVPDELRTELLNFPPRLPRALLTERRGGEDPLRDLAEELGTGMPEQGALLVDPDGSSLPCSMAPGQQLTVAAFGAEQQLPLARIAALRCESDERLSVFLRDGQRWLVSLPAEPVLTMTSDLSGEQTWRPSGSRPGTVLLLSQGEGEAPPGPLAELLDDQRVALDLADRERLRGTSPWGDIELPMARVLRLEPVAEPYPYLVLSLDDGSNLPLFPDASLLRLEQAGGDGSVPLRALRLLERTGNDVAALELGCAPAEAARELPTFAFEGDLGGLLASFGDHLGRSCETPDESRHLTGIELAVEQPAGSVAEQLDGLRARTGLTPRYLDSERIGWFVAAVGGEPEGGDEHRLQLASGWLLRGSVTVALSRRAGGTLPQGEVLELQRREDGSVHARLHDGQEVAVRFDDPLLTIEGPMGRLRVPARQCRSLHLGGED